MPEYYCKTCNFFTTHSPNYKRHLKTTKHERLTKTNINKYKNQRQNVEKSTETNTFSCRYCKKNFTTKQSMYRHEKNYCKNNQDENLKKLVFLLNKQLKEQDTAMKNKIAEMQKQIDKLTDRLQMPNVNNSVVNNTTTMTNTTNINNTIKILNYKNTDYSHLTDNDYVNSIMDCNKCVKTMIEKVHFNNEKPENMNVYISSIKGNYIMMYKDGSWQLHDRKEMIDDIYEKNEYELECWYDVYKDKYPEIIKSFQRYLKNKEESSVINDIKREILVMLYNKRKMVDSNIE